MKVVISSGNRITSYEFEDVEEYVSYIQAKSRRGIRDDISVTMTPLPAQSRPEPASRKRTKPTMKSANGGRRRPVNPPNPDRPWPGIIYVTKNTMEILDLMRQAHPEPVTVTHVAKAIGCSYGVASARIRHIRLTSPLIQRDDNTWKLSLTKIGSDPNLVITFTNPDTGEICGTRPGNSASRLNRALGWEHFMGRRGA